MHFATAKVGLLLPLRDLTGSKDRTLMQLAPQSPHGLRISLLGELVETVLSRNEGRRQGLLSASVPLLVGAPARRGEE